MRFDVHANGHHHAIDARRSGQGWLVTVNGRPLTADVTRAGERWSLLLTMRSYDVAIENRGRGERLVHVNGHAIAVSFANARPRPRGHDDASGPVAVESPMAGRVAKVLVSPGDAVTARQGLVIVEAMKMENELRAPRAGTVREVAAHEGALVDAGTVLVVIE